MRLGSPAGVVGWIALTTMALLACAVDAAASPSARLVYARAPEATACPDEAALRRAVGSRFGYDPVYAWANKTVVVQIWRDHLRFAARVQLVDDEGVSHGSREIVSDEKGAGLEPRPGATGERGNRTLRRRRARRGGSSALPPALPPSPWRRALRLQSGHIRGRAHCRMGRPPRRRGRGIWRGRRFLVTDSDDRTQ
jgi:hypothetical protein